MADSWLIEWMQCNSFDAHTTLSSAVEYTKQWSVRSDRTNWALRFFVLHIEKKFVFPLHGDDYLCDYVV